MRQITAHCTLDLPPYWLRVNQILLCQYADLSLSFPFIPLAVLFFRHKLGVSIYDAAAVPPIQHRYNFYLRKLPLNVHERCRLCRLVFHKPIKRPEASPEGAVWEHPPGGLKCSSRNTSALLLIPNIAQTPRALSYAPSIAYKGRLIYELSADSSIWDDWLLQYLDENLWVCSFRKWSSEAI